MKNHHQSKTKRSEWPVSKYIPKDAAKYSIYADQPVTYQADLMFEPYINTKKENTLQVILVFITVNTKYMFAEPVDYIFF